MRKRVNTVYSRGHQRQILCTTTQARRVVRYVVGEGIQRQDRVLKSCGDSTSTGVLWMTLRHLMGIRLNVILVTFDKSQAKAEGAQVPAQDCYLELIGGLRQNAVGQNSSVAG
jgi:hypothetical protein